MLNGEYVMSAAEMRETLAKLRMTQVQAAHLLCVDTRTVRRWVAGDVVIPGPVAMVFRLMAKYQIPVAEAQQLTRPDWMAAYYRPELAA